MKNYQKEPVVGVHSLNADWSHNASEEPYLPIIPTKNLFEGGLNLVLGPITSCYGPKYVCFTHLYAVG